MTIEDLRNLADTNLEDVEIGALFIREDDEGASQVHMRVTGKDTIHTTHPDEVAVVDLATGHQYFMDKDAVCLTVCGTLTIH